MSLTTVRLHRLFADGRLYAVLSAAGFGLKAIFVKLAYAAGPVDAVTLLAMRMGLALPVFVWLAWRGLRGQAVSLGGAGLLRVLALGAVGYYLSSLFDFYGLESISAGLERLILFSYPTLVLVFQAIAVRERPSLRTLQAVAVCYLGLGVAFVHDLSSAGGGTQVAVGAAWVFASAVTYALYYLGAGMMVKRLGSLSLAGLAGSTSALLVLAHYGLVAKLADLGALPRAVWGYAGLMALFSTVLPVYWLALAIQRLGTAQTAAIGNLGPVLTMVAAWCLLGESLSLYQVAGLGLVMLGVSRLKPSPSRTAAQPAPVERGGH